MAPSPQTLSVQDRQFLASWAADCADHVLPIFEDAVPGDERVRDAITQARAFAAGDLDVHTAIRRRGAPAGAAARDAPTPAATAAAYAAEQAAAVAHMGAHALGAAGYAGKAAVLAADGDGAEVIDAEARHQVNAMSTAVADAIRRLPALGTNRSGPLAAGRLSSGHVGATIRAIETLLATPTHGREHS
ncbi:putative immunity protein [Brachybacterium paraconglomeratum]|uniref:putative immunity protein n=1 Tax=Brachybacterium paraconglomeratum TaxID=173362 RepID=UPI0037C7934E